MRTCEDCGGSRESGIMRVCDSCFEKSRKRDEREREKNDGRGLPPHIARKVAK
jgi:NMD protein affecting ribosome stability and mRNA decay